MMKLARSLFCSARLVRDVEAVTWGKPDCMARRVKNNVVGRLLDSLGFWRRLWR